MSNDVLSAAGAGTVSAVMSPRLLHPDTRASDSDGDAAETDPRERTYKRFALWCGGLIVLMSVGQLMVQLTVQLDAIIQYYNDGNPCETTEQVDTDACKSATARATLMMSITGSAGAVLSFLGSPLLGTVSDALGRRPALLFCSVLNLVSSVALLTWAIGLTPLWLFYVAYTLSSFDATSVVLAVLSDTVPESKRTLWYGIIFGAISASAIVSPFLGTMFSPNVAFAISAVIAALFCLLCWLLPESLPVESRTAFSRSTLNPFLALRVLTRYKTFLYLSAVVFVNELVEKGEMDVLYPYVKTVFGFSKMNYSFAAVAFGVVGVLTQSVLLKFLTARYSNKKVMMIGLISVLLNMLAFALMFAGWEVYILVATTTLGYLTFPSISAMKSESVDVTEQGRIQGAIYGVKQLGGGAGPLIYGAVYQAMSTKEDGKVYYPQLVC